MELLERLHSLRIERNDFGDIVGCLKTKNDLHCTHYPNSCVCDILFGLTQCDGVLLIGFSVAKVQ